MHVTEVAFDHSALVQGLMTILPFPYDSNSLCPEHRQSVCAHPLCIESWHAGWISGHQ